ncbi:hypothetical protein [Nonomuraea sp. B1E8]|uniref:hypothetical protein n=1 Tax=unclassified Nonomuraea TaxID=2593643 RepID=UPI00325D814C
MARHAGEGDPGRAPEARRWARWETAARHPSGVTTKRPSRTAASAASAMTAGSSPWGDMAVRTSAGQSSVTPTGVPSSAGEACSARRRRA